jgi:acyl dehydratase
MIQVEKFEDYTNYIGKTIEPSEWVKIDQKMIDDFAEATWDRNWYHVDIERARRELPDGLTIAHGLLTLSLVPALSAKIMTVKNYGRALNYGYDRVRYPVPVQVEKRIRLHLRVLSLEPVKAGTLLRKGYSMELEGSDKPAMVTENMVLFLY